MYLSKQKIEKGKIMKKNGTNNLTIMLGIATVCLSMALIKEKTENTKIINNDNVRIEYTKLDKNNYNLIIQTKNDTNIQSKTSLEVGQNYGSLYLEGKSLNYYRKVWKNDLEPKGVGFQWQTQQIK